MSQTYGRKREDGKRINLVLFFAASVAVGLFDSSAEFSASEPAKVVRIGGKDRPVATFVAVANAQVKPSGEPRETLPSPPTLVESRPANSPPTQVQTDTIQRSLTNASNATTTAPTSTAPITTADQEKQEFEFTDLEPKSLEALGDYFKLPEVNLELIRDMFAEPTENSPAPAATQVTLVSHSLEGLGLTEVTEQSILERSDSPNADQPSAIQHAAIDREKQTVEALLNSINSPQTNLMQMQSIDAPQWLGQIHFAMLRYGSHCDLTLQDAIHTAIQFSPEIEILRADVGISQAEITKQQAGFDWASFIQSNWDERNVPVSSNLDGVFNRLENHTLANSLGVTKRNSYGGNVKVGQDLGFADSNSTFFNPQNQASARVAIDFQQPLLQGAGLLTARSRINIAVVDAVASQEQFIGGLQSNILNVIQAYWELTSTRGQYVVLKRSHDRALETATVVSNRVHLDVGPVQSARSEAILATRRAALLRSEFAVVLAQERLLRLMFGQYFNERVNTEVIPTSSMIGPSRTVDTELELQLGLQCRPEVRQSLQFIKRTSIEQGVARNQLLPLLGLTMSVSNKGLRGNNGLGSAFDDQFNFSDPTYGVGVAYSLPVGNRAAKANLRQTQIRLVRFQKEFETVVSNVALEIRNACHNVVSATQQRDATAQAMNLAERELHVLKSRAELLLDGDNVGPLYLDDLLTTQERLATAELAFINASTSHALSYFELQRANGSLMRMEPIAVEQFAGP